MPAVFLWLFAASGVVVRRRSGAGGSAPRRGSARVIAGAGVPAARGHAVGRCCARRPRSSPPRREFQRGNCRAAINDALASRDALSVRGRAVRADRLLRPARARQRARDPGVPGGARPRPGQLALRLRARAGPGPGRARTRARRRRDASRLNPREQTASDLARVPRGAPRVEPRRGRRELPPGLAGSTSAARSRAAPRCARGRLGVDRARRGGSGALHPQSALAGLNPLPRGAAPGPARRQLASMAGSRAM